MRICLYTVKAGSWVPNYIIVYIYITYYSSLFFIQNHQAFFR